MKRNRTVKVREVTRRQPDLRKLSRALIALAAAQLEAEAQATRPMPPVAPDQPTEPPTPESTS